MRVAMISEHASPLAVLGGVDAGGQNVHVAALARHLARLGVEVLVSTRRDDPSLARWAALAPGVAVHHVDAGPPYPIPKDDLLPYMDAFAADVGRVWRRWRPDVVHAHFWMSGLAALNAGRPLGIPVVETFHALGVVKRRHQGDRDTSPPERQDVERRVLAEVDRVVATCTDEVFELVRLGADVDKVKVVPCGVDLSHFSPEGPVEPRTPGLARLVVVSRLVERKGVGNVVTALAGVPGAEVVIAGGPDQADLPNNDEARRLMRLAEEAGVADRVTLRGSVDRADLPALLRSADAVLCVPWYEPFGIVALEAMACGVPVVASAVGGLIDTVVDGVTGIHVPPRSPQHLAAALRCLVEDPTLRRRLGTAGARRARRRYGWNRVAGSTLGVYGELLASADGSVQAEVRS
jgi:D-inositol-3-phosphate glycosyltransferase